MPLISVIVPVYKVETYLSECVGSILNQSFTDFEVILIDDGSLDRSGSICDKYALQDSRVKVIHQINQGLSGARNAGMCFSKAKYITFIDSDDIIANNYLLMLYEELVKEKADISSCICFDFVDKETNEFPECFFSSHTRRLVCDKRTALLELYKGNPLVLIGSPFKLYNRELLAELRFPNGRIHEDQAFTPKAFYKANKIVFIDAKAYYYRVREQSIMHQNFSKKRYDDLWAIDHCIEYFKQKNEREIVDAAQKKRMRMICKYAVLARRDEIDIPEQYRVHLLHALVYLRKNMQPTQYGYILAQVSPKLERLYEYERKIIRLFHLEGRHQKK